MSSVHTIIDSDGEVVSVMTCRNIETLLANTPENHTTVEGAPLSHDSYWANNQWNPRPVRPSNVHSWDVATKTWIDKRTIEQIRAHKISELRKLANANNDANIIVNSLEFDADQASRTALYREAQVAMTTALESSSLDLGESEPTVNWTLADNTIAALTADQIKQVVAAVHNRSQSIHDQFQSLRAAVDAASKVEIELISWTTI